MKNPLLNGFNKTQSVKRSETANEAKVRRKQNKWILLIQLLTKEYDLKQNKTLILDQILNLQLYISIFGSN